MDATSSQPIEVRQLSVEDDTTTSTDWSLSIRVNKDGEMLENAEIIWNGTKDSWPNASHLSEVLPIDIPESELSYIAVQAIHYAPVKALPALLSTLACNYWRTENNYKTNDKTNDKIKAPLIDVKKMLSFKDTTRRTVCGKVFSRGDIVWTCRQCAKDQTCVQCDDCFQHSDHNGHEVYFHTSSGSAGCCDCGDFEAWATAGNCIHHNHQSKVTADVSKDDPSVGVPPEFLRGLRPVLQSALGVIVSYIICSVRGYQPFMDNQFAQDYPDVPMVGRVHNDDVHTYEEVIRAFQHIGMTTLAATESTKKVDVEGEAVIVTGLPTFGGELQLAAQHIGDTAGLLLSITPKELYEMEPVISALFNWMQMLGQISPGIMRIVSRELFANLAQFPVDATALKFDLTAENFAFSPPNLLVDEEQFPRVVQQLSQPPLPELSLSQPVFGNPVGKQSSATAAAAASSPESSGNFGDEFLSLLTNPFDFCPKNSFAVMLMGSPFVSPATKKGINDIVIKFQHDYFFKSAFSQVITILYPSLYSLFFRSIGCMDNTIFQTTVQIFTASSVIAMMSSDGYHLQTLLEKKPVKILKMLIATILVVLKDAQTSKSGDFLSHHSVRTHRLSHLCRDLEYLTIDPILCARLLSGEVDKGAIEDWIECCAFLQGIDCHRRRVSVHIEQEDDSWQHAANLVIEMDSVSNHFISTALFDIRSTDNTTYSQKLVNEFSYSKASGVAIDNFEELKIKGIVECTVIALRAIRELHQMRIYHEFSPDMCEMFFSGQRRIGFVCLGTPINTEHMYKYRVSHSPVSIHIPLHRFIAKLILYGASGNVPLHPLVEYIVNMDQQQKIDLVDFPLRCLSFMSQANAGMWRRNGSMVAHLAYNYSRAPLCKVLRDIDIISAQTGLIALGPDYFLAFAIERFELASILNDPTDIHSFRVTDSIAKDYYPAVLGEFLRILLHIITYPPVCQLEGKGIDCRTEGWSRSLAREVSHLLLSGATTVTALQKAKAMIGNVRCINEEMLAQIIDQLCDRRDQSDIQGSDSSSLKPKEICYNYYDPDFPNLSSTQAVAAADSMKEFVKSKADSSDQKSFFPIVNKDYLPIVHQSFAAVRSILFRPMFFTLLNRCLRLCLTERSDVSSNFMTIVGRVIHLVTLQILLISEDYSILDQGLFERSSWTTPANIFRAFDAPLDDSSDFFQGCGQDLLKCLTTLWHDEVVKEDLFYHKGLGWILKEISQHSIPGREYLLSQGVSFEESAIDAARADEEAQLAEKKKRQQEAQRKAAEEMQKKAALFFAAMDDDDDDDEEEYIANSVQPSSTAGADDAEDKTSSMKLESGCPAALENDGKDYVNSSRTMKIHYDAFEPDCIICREKNNSPIGYLCLLQPSNNLKNTFIRSNCVPELNNVYRVVSLSGCNVYSAPVENSKNLIHHLEQNDHVLVKNLSTPQGRWLNVISPVEGWCAMYELRSGVSSTIKPSINRDILQDICVNLHPISDLLCNRFGGTKVHVSRCNHAMHTSCWDKYRANRYRFFSLSNRLSTFHSDADYAAYLNSHHSGDHIAVEIARGEVLCPLCKSLTNGLIPYIAPAVGAALISTEDLVVSDKVFESVQPSTLLDLFVKSSSMQSMQLQASWQLNNITNKDSCNGISSKMNAFFHACLIQYNMLSMGDSYDRIHPTTAFRSIRAAHAAWAAVSYTLLDSTVKSLRSRESIGMSVQLPTILESERSLIVALLATLRSAPTLFANAKEYEEYIALPIKYILVGYDSSISIETSLSSESFDALEMSLSKSTKSSNSTMSWSDRFSSFVSTAQSIGFSVPSSSVSNSVKLGSTDEFRLIPEASCKKADLEMYLSSCPLETVETVLFPDSNTITSAILLARGKGVADKDLWPILKAPLLAHDLHMISMAVLSTASNLSTFSTWNSIVCLCRLVQILIEPQSIGLASNSAKSKTGNEFYSEDISRKKAKLTANSPSSKNNQLDDVVETIENLRNTVCQQSGVSMQEYVPSGSRLLKLVLQSWIPFLEYSYHLRQGVECVAGNMKASDVTVPTASKDSHDELSLLYEYATLILKALDVPDLVNLVQLTSTKRLFKFWTSHYYIFNKGVSSLASVSATGDKHNNEKINFYPHVDDVDAVKASSKSPACRVEPNGENDFDKLISYSNQGQASTNNTPVKIAAEPSDIVNNSSIGGIIEEDEENDDRSRGDSIEGNDGMLLDVVNDLPEMQAFMEAFMFNMDDSAFMDTSYEEEAAASNSNNSESVYNLWKLVGINPVNPHLDEHKPDLLVVNGDQNKLKVIHTKAPLLGTISGTEPIYSINGERLRYNFPDISHFGCSITQAQSIGLVQLPHLYTDLYKTAKFPRGPNAAPVEHPCICLICGTILDAGNRLFERDVEGERNPGECTLHSRHCGAGIGVFFVLQQHQVLLIRNSRSSYSSSIYCDSLGEVTSHSGQNRPMYLSKKRYTRLEEMYVNHQIAREVARKRASEDRVIRQYWY